MPKGGRRRGRGRRRWTQGAAARDQATSAAKSPAAGQPPTGRRRRRGRGAGGQSGSVFERMAGPRPKILQTLPDDGVVLDELIATMQQEYGTPATPQEYRLLIKVPTDDAKAPPPEPQDLEEVPAPAVETPPRPPRRRRGGRRGRRTRPPGTPGANQPAP